MPLSVNALHRYVVQTIMPKTRASARTAAANQARTRNAALRRENAFRDATNIPSEATPHLPTAGAVDAATMHHPAAGSDAASTNNSLRSESPVRLDHLAAGSDAGSTNNSLRSQYPARMHHPTAGSDAASTNNSLRPESPVRLHCQNQHQRSERGAAGRATAAAVRTATTA